MITLQCRGCGLERLFPDGVTSYACEKCSTGPTRMLPYDERMEVLRRVYSMISLLDAIEWEIRMIRQELEGAQ